VISVVRHVVTTISDAALEAVCLFFDPFVQAYRLVFGRSELSRSALGQLTKRVIDLVGSVLLLLIFLVPMLIIAVLVRLSSDGPVLFRQGRMAPDGRTIRVYKFRTMTQPATDDIGASESPFASSDQRVTRVGRSLRRTSLDELPQLFNVLVGDMSLVGPSPRDVKRTWKSKNADIVICENIKAGVTGWARVNGIRDDNYGRTRIQYDSHYVQNWSIWIDLRILVRSAFQAARNLVVATTPR